MKLEHEVATLDCSPAQNLSTAQDSPILDASQLNFANQSSAAEDQRQTIARMVRDGIAAAKAGDHARARKVLQDAVYLDNRHETALMWLASISDRPIDLLGYLQEVLHVNPHNQRAAQWAAATKAMLAKSLIQQGAATAKEAMPEIAAQYFLQAVEYEPANEAAWLWLVSVSPEPEDKLSYLNRVLQINPAHEKAAALFDRTKTQIARRLLQKAAEAAQSSDFETAHEILRDVLDDHPNLEEAWLLKANLCRDLNEKAVCLERVLEINRENQAAADELARLAEQEQTTIESAQNQAEVVQEQTESAPEQVEFAPEQVEFAPEQLTQTESLETEIARDAASEVCDSTADQIHTIAAEHAEAAHNGESFINEQYSDCSESLSEQSESFAEQSQDLFEAANDFSETSANDSNDAETFSLDAEAAAQNVLIEQLVDSPSNFAGDCDESAASDEAAADAAVAAPETFAACQYCANENSSANARCTSCGAFVRLADYERLLNNELNDESAVREFIEKHQARAAANELDAAEYFDLGLAFLNLRNARKAVGHFENVLRLAVDDEAQSREINDLFDYLKTRMPELFGAIAAANGKKILVVDDSPTVRKLISGKLEKHGHTVIAAVDGMDALSKLSETVPDLIFLDVTMPRLDGYQLCKLVKANGKTKHVPVVMISGKDGFFDKVRGRMAGSTAYITKPFGPETLLQTVETYCK